MNLRIDQTKYRTYLEDGKNANETDSWRFYDARGRKGQIWPYSHTHLACLILSNRIGERIRRAYPHWKLIQNGENEMCFILENKFLDDSAQVVGSRRKPILTPERREELRKRMGSMRSKMANLKENGGS